MITKHVTGFAGSLLGLPVLAQAATLPDDIIGKLAIGSAQFVLAAVAVIEGVAIYRGAKYYCDEIEKAKKAEQEARDKQRAEEKEEREKLSKVIVDATAASTVQAETNRELKESLSEFAHVIQSCRIAQAK